MYLLLACADPAALDTAADTFVPPAAPESGVQVHVPAVTLAPGEERERCLYLPGTNEADAWVSRIEMVGRPGLHHAMLVKAGEERTDEVECFGIPEDVMADYTNVPEPMYASSTQVTEETVAFPDGVAIPLAARQPLMVNYHLINPTDEDSTGEVWINLHFAEPDAEVEAARLYAMGAIVNIAIPAQSDATLSTTCTFPADAHLLSLTPHMHQRGRSFSADLVTDAGDIPLLATGSWENPETEWFAPPVDVTAGDALRFTCAWTNDTDVAIGFGASADEEMCMVFGYHWPADTMLWRADYDSSACTSG